MIDRIFYFMMVVGFLVCSVQAPTLKMKIIGCLLTAVNGLLFWK